MLLPATSLASALLASSLLAARPPAPLPPLLVDVIVASDISPSLVTRVLAEAADIWRAAGLAIVWKLDGRVSSSLRVTIGHWANRVMRDELTLPLGWIGFEDDGRPADAIYVSYANATALLDQSRGGAGLAERMPRAERETMLGRAMGRALAHEMGHYLLASKVHSVKGLMRAKRTATEFFAIDRARFDLDAEQRAAIAARLMPPAVLASLQSAVGSPASR